MHPRPRRRRHLVQLRATTATRSRSATTRSTTPATPAPARACTSAATTRRARSRTRSSRTTTSTTSAATQGDGIEIKDGAHNNVVRDNVIIRTNYPGITMYGFARQRAPPNVVERNLIWHTKRQRDPDRRPDHRHEQHRARRGGERHRVQGEPGHHDRTTSRSRTTRSSAPAPRASRRTTGRAGTNQIVANNAFYCAGGTAVDITGGAGADVVLAGNRRPRLGAADRRAHARRLGRGRLPRRRHRQHLPRRRLAADRSRRSATTVMEDFNGLPCRAARCRRVRGHDHDEPRLDPRRGLQGSAAGQPR